MNFVLVVAYRFINDIVAFLRTKCQYWWWWWWLQCWFIIRISSVWCRRRWIDLWIICFRIIIERWFRRWCCWWTCCWCKRLRIIIILQRWIWCWCWPRCWWSRRCGWSCRCKCIIVWVIIIKRSSRTIYYWCSRSLQRSKPANHPSCSYWWRAGIYTKYQSSLSSTTTNRTPRRK